MSSDKQKFQNTDLHENKLRIFIEHFPEAIITKEDENGNKTYEIDANKLNTFFNGRESVLIHTPEKPKDGYELSWVGKKFAYQEAFQKGDKILKIERNISKNFDKTENVVLIGDNIHALKLLRENYHNSIKCIYIDPPYNTGTDGFIYKDKFSENDEAICEILGYDEGYKDFIKNISSSKTHSAWMSFMLSRLLLAKELLTDDGVIFISIDDNEQANLKIICDEIFGEQNFEGHIHWRRRHNQPNDKTKMIGLVAEHIIVYAKNTEILRATGVGKIDLTGTFSNPDNDLRGNWASKPWKVGSDQSGSHYKITTPNSIVLEEEWMGEESTYNALLADNRIIFPRGGDGLPRKKYFEYERKEEGQCATNWWEHSQFGHNQGANDSMTQLFSVKNIFSNPKPVELLRGLIQISNAKNNDLILDFFAGSGTIGDAVMQLNAEDGENRRFILVQLDEKIDSNDKKSKVAYDFCKDNNFPPVISSITIERLNRAGEKIIKEKNELKDKLDIGYRVFSIKDDLEHKLLNIPISDLKEDDWFSKYESMKKDSELYSRENLLYNAFIYNNIPLSAKVKVLKENILYSVDDKFFCFGELSRDELENALENYPNASFTIFVGGEYASDSFIHTCKAHLEQISRNITFKVHG